MSSAPSFLILLLASIDCGELNETRASTARGIRLRITVDHLLVRGARFRRVTEHGPRLADADQRIRALRRLWILARERLQLGDRFVVCLHRDVALADPILRVVGEVRARMLLTKRTEE